MLGTPSLHAPFHYFTTLPVPVQLDEGFIPLSSSHNPLVDAGSMSSQLWNHKLDLEGTLGINSVL